MLHERQPLRASFVEKLVKGGRGRMNRVRVSVLMLAAAAAACVMIFSTAGGEQTVRAKVAEVVSGDVEKVAVLTGRIRYADELVVLSSGAGLVSQVYVEAGQGVQKGEALFRLEATEAEKLASAWIAASAAASELPYDAAPDVRSMLDAMVIRAPADGTIRQVTAAQGGAVAAGMPVAVMSSARQEIVCVAAEADARALSEGMWARLEAGGESYGMAYVAQIGHVEADVLTGRTQCQVVLKPEYNLPLPAGAALEVQVHLDGRVSVPVLPVEAITARNTVWWVCDGICTEIPVEIILSDEKHAWINLAEGTRVALGEFREGQRIAEVSP